MPYTAEHKQRTRQHIVDSARELFNADGFAEVSIDRIMARAGLTRGGFYNHFDTKEDLFLEVIEDFGRCNPADRWDRVDLDFGAEPEVVARQMVDAYLSLQHLDDLAGHCPLMALPNDVAQTSPRLREAYSRSVTNLALLFEAGVQPSDHLSRGQLSKALVALCVGGMVIARTTDDQDLANEFRESARALARGFVDASG